jgi:acetyl-CoA acetyltransferase
MGRTARAAIVGFGFSPLSRKPIGTITELAAAALAAALDDAGLSSSDLDGLLLVQSELAARSALGIRFRDDLGLADLALLNVIEAKGSSVVQMVQQATLAVEAGLANTVACLFSDAPVSAGKGAGQSYVRPTTLSGIDGWEERYGLFGAIGSYALAARRYMDRFGLDESHLGAYAIACRKWAAGNPLAFARNPLDLATYRASPFVVEPFRVLDCALPVNGAAAVIVTSVARATDAKGPAAFIHGMGQGHDGHSGLRTGGDNTTGGRSAARRATAMAGVTPADISMCQLYDAFSFSGLFALEDYGLCGPGEAGDFVAEGHTAPGGRLPVNTGGGQLSGYYLQGMTPLSEAIIQARGRGGARQVARNDVILCNGSGGCLEFHAALIMSPHKVLS